MSKMKLTSIETQTLAHLPDHWVINELVRDAYGWINPKKKRDPIDILKTMHLLYCAIEKCAPEYFIEERADGVLPYEKEVALRNLKRFKEV